MGINKYIFYERFKIVTENHRDYAKKIAKASLMMDKAYEDMLKGVTAADYEVATMLRKTGKPIVLVCNKADNIGETPNDIYEFYNLGLGEPLPVSAINQLGTGEVLDAIYNNFPEEIFGVFKRS